MCASMDIHKRAATVEQLFCYHGRMSQEITQTEDQQDNSLDNFFSNIPAPERKVTVHNAGTDSVCVSCES